MDQTLRFRAEHVTFDACDDENVAHVFLRSGIVPQRHYLMINRSVDARKKSEVFLEYNDESHVAIGGIARCELHPDHLDFELEQKAAQALGIPSVRHVLIDFDIESKLLAELRLALEAIFADFAVFV